MIKGKILSLGWGGKYILFYGTEDEKSNLTAVVIDEIWNIVMDFDARADSIAQYMHFKFGIVYLNYQNIDGITWIAVTTIGYKVQSKR